MPINRTALDQLIDRANALGVQQQDTDPLTCSSLNDGCTTPYMGFDLGVACGIQALLAQLTIEGYSINPPMSCDPTVPIIPAELTKGDDLDLNHHLPTPRQFQQLKARSMQYSSDHFPECDPAIIPLLIRLESHLNLAAVMSCEGHVGKEGSCFSLMVTCQDDAGVALLQENFCRVLDWCLQNQEQHRPYGTSLARNGELRLVYKLMPPPLSRAPYPVFVMDFPILGQAGKDALFEALNAVFFA